jgi:hypothetical protein
MAQVTFSYDSFAKPAWQAEQLTPDKLVPGGARVVASAFPLLNQVTVTVGAAGAAVDDTTIPIDALTVANATNTDSGVVIPSGTTLDFGGDKFATLTADASVGDTTLTVRALVTAVVDNDTATYLGTGVRVIPAGTLVGRTFAERTANTGYGQPDVSTPDDELYLTANVVIDADINPDVTLIRHGTLIYEDKLPGWAGLSSDAKAVIRARYQCIESAA